MIRWISKALIIAIHERQLAEHGGIEGLRDETLLASALARPQQRHAYADPAPDLAELAASLAYGLARNHPFADGNKRTAAVACETCLLLNGVTLDADDVALYPIYIGLAEGSLGESEFADWIRQHLAPKDNAVQESTAGYQRKAER